MTDFFTTFFSEKNLDERTYEVAAEDGTPNMIPTSMVIAAIKQSQGRERWQLEQALRHIDMLNGDVHHFLNHLAKAMAISFG